MNRTQLLSSVLVFSGMLFVAPAGSAQTRGFGVVSGEVKSEGGEQVAGVSVKFMLGSGEPLSALVAKDGKWRAIGVGKGQWRVIVAAPGYTSKVFNVLVEQEATSTNLILTVLKKTPAKAG